MISQQTSKVTEDNFVEDNSRRGKGWLQDVPLVRVGRPQTRLASRKDLYYQDLYRDVLACSPRIPVRKLLFAGNMGLWRLLLSPRAGCYDAFRIVGSRVIGWRDVLAGRFTARCDISWWGAPRLIGRTGSRSKQTTLAHLTLSQIKYQ